VVVGWIAAVVVIVSIVAWGVNVIGIPENPATDLAPLATQVALPQTRDPADAMDPKDRFALQRDLIEYAADSRIRTWTLLAQVIGAVILGIGGYFTWRSLHVAQEGQITGRFTAAIGQLGAELTDGKPNLEVRLGGIYALERIARDSPRDHWTIMEVLTGYVHHNAPWPPAASPSPADAIAKKTDASKPRSDIQAILKVLGRRTAASAAREPFGLDLRGVDLRQADLSSAYLVRAMFNNSNLQQANFIRAHLEDAQFTGADLRGADLSEAHSENAIYIGTDMKGTVLRDTFLAKATLSGSDLTYGQVAEAFNKAEGVIPPFYWERDWRHRTAIEPVPDE
jgi:hypothetical protein